MQSDLATRLRSIAKVLDDRVVPVVTGMGHVEAKVCTKAAVGELRDLADEWYEPTNDETYLLILGLEAIRDQALKDAEAYYNAGRTESGNIARDESRRAEELRTKLKAKAGYDPKEVTIP